MWPIGLHVLFIHVCPFIILARVEPEPAGASARRLCVGVQLLCHVQPNPRTGCRGWCWWEDFHWNSPIVQLSIQVPIVSYSDVSTFCPNVPTASCPNVPTAYCLNIYIHSLLFLCTLPILFHHTPRFLTQSTYHLLSQCINRLNRDFLMGNITT